MNQNEIYQTVTDKILKQLNQGKIPWRKPWTASGMVPQNFLTKRQYSGVNQILLSMTEFSSPYWLTFNQIRDLGGAVLKGAKSEIIVFWKILEIKDSETGKNGKIPFLKYFNVFNVEQTSGLEDKIPTATTALEFNSIEKCEEILKGYQGCPVIRHGGDIAGYSPALDVIQMPAKSAFKSSQSYYGVLLHEVIHSSGSKNRLAREGVMNVQRFSNHIGSMEELIAECGSSFLLAQAGIDNNDIFENSVAYIQSWIKVFQNDPKILITAAGRASKAVDFILGKRVQAENDNILKMAA